MFDNPVFEKLVSNNNLTGEVISAQSFIVRVKGLRGIRLGAQVLFEDGQRGLVRETSKNEAVLFNISSEHIKLGTLAVLEAEQLQVPVGPELIGRVLTPTGIPLDNISTAPTPLAS